MTPWRVRNWADAVNEVTHACPPDGSGLTPCCGMSPFELSPWDRITLQPELVNCPGPAAPPSESPRP